MFISVAMATILSLSACTGGAPAEEEEEEVVEEEVVEEGASDDEEREEEEIVVSPEEEELFVTPEESEVMPEDVAVEEEVAPVPETIQPSQDTGLTMHFIDTVGDSILIDLNETEILIDGGSRDEETTVATYLSEWVDGPLEVMVITHGHLDHFGGLIDVLDKYDVNEIWANRQSQQGHIGADEAPADLLNALSERMVREDAEFRVLKRGDSIRISALSFDVLNPGGLLDVGENNGSLVLRMTYGNVTALFAGDIHKDTEANILELGLLIGADILKVAHHGTDSSSSTPFIEAVKPTLAICLTKFLGHADERVINTLTGTGAKFYDTKVHGTIVITTDGEIYTVETET